MSLKILHFADVHLGRGFSGYGDASQALSEARYKTLENLIAKANKEECDVVVIAGDLFDRTSMNKQDVVRAVQSLNKFQRGPVLLLPGNHDFITSESKLWGYVRDVKEENILILGETEPLDLKDYDLNVVVYPAPCQSKHSAENQISWVKDFEKDESKIHIGVAHGSVNGIAPDFNDKHFPMSQQELNAAGVDVWLLGHIHVPWPENPGGNDSILYSGTPEPDTANCPHRGTALIIEIEDGGSRKIQKLTTGMYRFERWEKNVSSLTDLENIAKEASAEDNKNCACRITIYGVLEPEDYNNWNSKIIPQLRKFFLYLKINDGGLKKRITKEQLEETYPEGSFPIQLLSGFIDRDDQMALQIAYDLLEEVRDEN
ncbi:MAG: DNA repair exonuclease [Balneolaceae bacterium]